MVYQFEMWFPNDVYGEYGMLEEFAKVLDLIKDGEDIEDIVQEEANIVQGEANIFFVEGEGRFVCIDISSGDYILPLVVLCLDNYAEKVRAKMFEMDNECRAVYGQKPREVIENVFYREQKYTLLRKIEESNDISIHDRFLKYE